MFNARAVMFGRRKFLFEKQGGSCYYCATAMVRAGQGPSLCTVDEKHPRSKGGRRVLSNQVAACKRCNGLKGSMSFDNFMSLIKSGKLGEEVERDRAARRAARRLAHAKKVESVADLPANRKERLPRPPADLTRVYCASVEAVFADVLAIARASALSVHMER